MGEFSKSIGFLYGPALRVLHNKYAVDDPLRQRYIYLEDEVVSNFPCFFFFS